MWKVSKIKEKDEPTKKRKREQSSKEVTYESPLDVKNYETDEFGLEWKKIDIPDAFLMSCEFGGLCGLEEIDGVDVQYDNGNDKSLGKIIKLSKTGDVKSLEGKKKGKKTPKEKQAKRDVTQSEEKDKENVQKNIQVLDEKPIIKDEKGDEILDTSVQESVDTKEWEFLNLNSTLTETLAQLKFSKPSTVQRAVLEYVKHHPKDNLAIAASTGSGKTLAFGLPILDSYLNSNRDSEDPYALIVAPTRELAIQIYNHLKPFADKIEGFRMIKLVGGLAIQKQIRIIKNSKPKIVIATVGRLWEFLSTPDMSELSETLSKIRYFVIDEADKMIETAKVGDIQNIVKLLNQKCAIPPVSIVCSATFTDVKVKLLEHSDQQSMDKLFKRDFYFIDVSDSTTKGQVERYRLDCLKNDKDLFVFYVCKYRLKGKTIIFANSIDCVVRLYDLLKLLQMNNVFQLHSKKQQKQRIKTLEQFYSRQDAILICSDVAARGIDIKGVDHVVHYHMPTDKDTFIHRSGRTARMYANGQVLCMVCPEEESTVRKYQSELQDFKKLPCEYLKIDPLRKLLDLARKVYTERRNSNRKDTLMDEFKSELGISDSETEDKPKKAKSGYKEQLAIALTNFE